MDDSSSQQDARGPRGQGGDSLKTSWGIQDEASALGFDWPDITGVFAKVREELGEIEAAWHAGDRPHARLELGDLLFATVNLARFLDADPGEALDRANRRFTGRFDALKEILKGEGRSIESCSFEELDAVWDRVKKERRGAEK